jgi:hypothetical protein
VGLKVCVEEVTVGKLVTGILVKVGRHVSVQDLQGLLVGGIAQSQLGVLLPKVGLDVFNGRQEAQDGGIAVGDPVLVLIAERF